MNPWQTLLADLQHELLRLSQEVAGQRVLPNVIEVEVPAVEMRRFAPAVEAIAAEIGESLVAWQEQEGLAWFGEAGPDLSLALTDTDRQSVLCTFGEASKE